MVTLVKLLHRLTICTAFLVENISFCIKCVILHKVSLFAFCDLLFSPFKIAHFPQPYSFVDGCPGVNLTEVEKVPRPCHMSLYPLPLPRPSIEPQTRRLVLVDPGPQPGPGRGATHHPKSTRRSTFSHKVDQNWGFCSRVWGGGSEIQTVPFQDPKLGVHFLGVPLLPKIDPGYGPEQTSHFVTRVKPGFARINYAGCVLVGEVGSLLYDFAVHAWT